MTRTQRFTDDRRELSPRRGDGLLEVSLCAGRSAVTRCQAHSPLKLLTPQTRSHAAWVYTSTYGGGLLGGDNVRLQGHLGPGSTCCLATQSSTKIYGRRGGIGCTQSLDLHIADGALAVVIPDALVCFAGADFQQRQRFYLEGSAALILVDQLSSGRRARGERWAMARCDLRTDIFVDDEPVFWDAMSLDPADGALAGHHRMGRFDCIATVVMIGQPLRAACDSLARQLDNGQLGRDAPGPVAVSPIPGGLLLRVVGDGTESVARWLRKALHCVPPLLGEDPWERKW